MGIVTDKMNPMELRLMINKSKAEEDKDSVLEKAEDYAENFKQFLKSSLRNPENQNLAHFLKELDGKSSETFAHSVNVAMHVYADLSQSGKYNQTDVNKWTLAALVHDAGKLQTPLDVLHSKVNAMTLPDKERQAFWEEMHKHSIEGRHYLHEHDFEKEAIASAVCHHVDAIALEKGPEGEFEGATMSREDEWTKLYGKKGVEKILMEECAFLKPRDIKAIENIVFNDIAEALRATDRRYQEQHDWIEDNVPIVGKPGKTSGMSVLNILERPSKEIIKNNRAILDKGGDIIKGHVAKEYKDRVSNLEFQKEFDAYQAMKIPDFVRDILLEVTKDYNVPLSEDKIKDIIEKPHLGLEFYERSFDGQNYIWSIDLGEEFGKKYFPSTQGGTRPDFALGEIIPQVMEKEEVNVSEVVENNSKVDYED